MQIKLQRHTTTHLLEWENIVTVAHAGQDVEQWDLLYIAGGHVN